MANLNAKGIKITKKKHKILTRKLYPKGIKAYIAKRDGRTQFFDTYAEFEYFGIEFDRYRNASRIEFAVSDDQRFERDSNTRTMRQVAEIATHIALVKPNGESIVYAILKGDEFQPLYLDFSFKYYCTQVSDRFVPANNE